MVDTVEYGGIFGEEVPQEYGGIFGDTDKPPQVAEPVPEETEEGISVGQRVKEVPLNLLGGVGSFIKETVGTAVDWPAEALQNKLGEPLSLDRDEASPEVLQLWDSVEGTQLFTVGSKEHRWISGEGMQKLKEANFYNLTKIEDFTESIVYDLGDVRATGNQQTFVGGAIGGITQFLSGWVALAPVKGLQVVKDAPMLAQLGQATLKGAVVDFTVFDAHEARMSDMLKGFGLENDWVNYLASEGNEDDTIFEGKLKNALEGAMIGSTAEATLRLIMYGARSLRSWWRTKDPELTPEKRQAEEANALELQEKLRQEGFKDPSEVELKTEDGVPVRVETPETTAKQFDEQVGTVVDTLPPELQKADPRYNYGQTPIKLEFENDIAKALYIVGGKDKSKAHEQYIAFLESAGIKDIAGEAAKIRANIKAQAKAGETTVTVAKVKPRVKYNQGLDTIDETVEVVPKQTDEAAPTTKPRVEGKPVQKMSKEELDLLTKEERAELGSLRSPDDVGTPKTIPLKKTISEGRALISKLLKDAKADDIVTFVKSLKEVTIRPEQGASFTKALQVLKEDVSKALALVDDSVEYKAGDPSALQKKRQLVEAHLSLHAQIEGAGSSWGRALNALRAAVFSSRRDLSTYFGDDLARAQKKIIDKEIKAQKAIAKKDKELSQASKEGGLTPSQENKALIRRLRSKVSQVRHKGHRAGDMVVEFIASNLLANWRTQVINPIANSVMMLVNNFETAGGGLIALARGDTTAAARQLRRAIYQTVSMKRNAAVATRAMWEVLMTGKNKLDPDFKVKEEAEGAVDTVSIGKDDVDLRNLSWEELSNMSLLDIFGNVQRLPFRGLAAGDEFFKQLNFRAVYGALIQEEYLKQAKHLELDPATFVRFIDSKVDEGVAILEKFRLGEEALTKNEERLLGEIFYARKQTREATFTDPLGKLGQNFQKLINDSPAVRILLQAWYVRTPSNIFKFPLRRLPLANLASRRFRDMMIRGGDDRDRAIFEMVYMSATLAMLSDIVDERVQVPDGKGGTIEMYRYQGTLDSKTYNNVKNLQLTGLQPHSVYFEDSQTFRNTQRFDPADTLLMTMVNRRDLRDSGQYEEWDEMGVGLLIAFMNLAQDKTFTQGITTSVDALSEPETNFESYMESYGRSITPALLKQLGSDDVYREVRGFGDAMLSQIPFLSEGMEPKFDRLGQPMEKPDQSGFTNGLAKATFLTNDPVRLEFLTMNSNIADISRQDGDLDWEAEEYYVDGKSAWWRFNEVYSTIKLEGKNLEETLAELISSDDYKAEATVSEFNKDGVHEAGSKEKAILRVLNGFENAAKDQVKIERADLGMLKASITREINKKKQLSQEHVNTDDSVIDKAVADFLNSIK